MVLVLIWKSLRVGSVLAVGLEVSAGAPHAGFSVWVSCDRLPGSLTTRYQSAPSATCPNNRYRSTSTPYKNPTPPVPTPDAHSPYSSSRQTANASPRQSSAHSHKQFPSPNPAAHETHCSHSACKSMTTTHIARCSRSQSPRPTCQTASPPPPAQKYSRLVEPPLRKVTLLQTIPARG